MGVGAREELIPVGDAADHPAHVDEVEVVAREGPVGIAILDFTDILVSFVFPSSFQGGETGARCYNFRFDGTNVGWIGVMSVPVTVALGY